EIAHYSGVAASGWSWASAFMDVNLDGREDLLVATGYLYDVLDLDTQSYMYHIDQKHPHNLKKIRSEILLFPPLKLNNKIFKNNGNLTFTDVSTKWGFSQKDVS